MYLATRGTEGTIGRDGDRVQVASVVIVILLQTAVGQVPDLDLSVPTARNDDGVVVVGREAHARNPVRVSFFLDGVLALGKGVPQLDRLVAAARDDLTVVGRERHAQHVLQNAHFVKAKATLDEIAA